MSGSLGVGDKSSVTDQDSIPQAQARSGGGIKASTVCARGWPLVGGWGERSLGDRDWGQAQDSTRLYSQAQTGSCWCHCEMLGFYLMVNITNNLILMKTVSSSRNPIFQYHEGYNEMYKP